VNSCSSTTSSSRTNPNAARTARGREWQWLELRRTDRRAGIRTPRRRPGRTARSAGKRPRCHSGRHKDVRCCAASVFSRGGKSRAPDYSLNLGKWGQPNAHPVWRAASCALKVESCWRNSYKHGYQHGFSLPLKIAAAKPLMNNESEFSTFESSSSRCFRSP